MAINRAGSSTVIALLLLASAGASQAADLRLIEAAKARRIETVRTLIRGGVAVNARYGDDSTALHWAAYWDDRETVDLLLAAGAQVNAADDHGVTPLWLACANGATAPTIERLIRSGATTDVRHSSGESALMSAARTGNTAAVGLLLSSGVDVGAAERNRGQTALMWAAAQGHTDIVQRLLEAGADVHARSKARRQVVNSTGNADYTGVMEVEAGGFTALLFAARGGHVDAARRLLAAGAPVNDAAADGTSALVTAAHSGHSAAALALLEAGADPNAVGSGYAALHIAIRRGDLALVQALIARGARPDVRLVRATPARRLSDDVALTRSLVGATPLWLAAFFGHAEIVSALATAGADLNAGANDGSTPLMAAIGRNAQAAANVARRLIDAGADVNAADESGGTVLHRAVSAGFNDVVRRVAEKGANLEARNRQGQTPLMLARPRRTPQGVEQNATAELLRSLGAKN